MANRYAKKTRKDTGVFWAANKNLVNEMLEYTAVGDIWGIGRQYALFLKTNGFKTAADFVKAPEEWVRVNMSVVGLRLIAELKGTPAVQWDFDPPPKKNICTSRSFGRLLSCKEEIAEAVSNYTANCALKLRQQKSCCKMMNVFIQTNPMKTEQRQYARSIDIELETASNNTAELIKYAMKGLNIIYQPDYLFLKAGVIVSDLVPENNIQHSLFNTVNRNKNQVVMEAMDKINRSIGKETVRMAVQGFEKTYRRRAKHLSPCYTTNIDHLLKVMI
jgi:DNA polymerase V